MGFPGHFEVWSVVLPDREDFRRFSSEWQVWHFLHLAKTLAGVDIGGGFEGHLLLRAQYLVNLDDALYIRKSCFVKLS